MNDTLVVCLCAAWCDTCAEFRDTFARLERAHPGAQFAWLDVEDDAALVGDIDIENFPTLAVFRDSAPLFYGVTLPQEGVVARTLSSVLEETQPVTAVPKEIAGLPAALRPRLEGRDRG
jgi:thioredoxin reductase (NADPH)